MKLTIGRNQNNELIIDHLSVSNEHAVITQENEEGFFIKDLDSANGTFVNDTRIAKKKINFSEKIRLGDFLLNNQAIKKKIKEIKNRTRIDFTEEFNQLETVYDDYTKALNKIEKMSKLIPLLIRSGVTAVIAGVMFLVFGDWKFFIIAGIVSGLLTTLFIKPTSAKEKKEELLLDYSPIYTCPKCASELISKTWKYWKKKGECSNTKCDAHWT